MEKGEKKFYHCIFCG